jgi:hypothetical protein
MGYPQTHGRLAVGADLDRKQTFPNIVSMNKRKDMVLKSPTKGRLDIIKLIVQWKENVMKITKEREA